MTPTPEEMVATMITNLAEKTGKSIDEWVAIAKKTGLEKHGQIVKALKSQHGLTHGYANLVAHETLKADQPAVGDDALVAAQYAGAKADLKPIYDKLVAAVAKFGDDVELAPKKTYVSLRRSKQFGLIQPSTKTRVDVGIKLADTEPGERLEASGSFNQMVSHRVRVESVAEVDRELIGWLRAAYDEA